MEIKDWIKQYLVSRNVVQLSSVKTKDIDRKQYPHILDNTVLRSVADNEIIIEFDTSRERAEFLIKLTIKKLRANNYNFCVFDHNGRSPHIHIYNIKGMDELEPRLRHLYKIEFCKKYTSNRIWREAEVDHSLQGESLIAMEYANHWRHGTKKELIYSCVNMSKLLSNKLDIKLLLKAQGKYQKELSRKIELNRDPEFNKRGVWLAKWLLTQPSYKHMMDMLVFKNVAIALVNNKFSVDNYIKQLSDIMLTNKHNVRHELMGWIRWAEREPRTFSFGEVCRFFEIHEMDGVEIFKQWHEGD